MKTVSFIGSGNMGGAVAKAAAKVIDPSQIVVTNRTLAKAESLAKEINCVVAKNNVEACKNVRYIILCVKPQMMDGVLDEIREQIEEEKKEHELTLCTIAAGKTIDFYQEKFADKKIDVIRLMPNMNALVGEAMTLLVRSKGTSDEKVAEIEKILAESGKIKEIEEKDMDAACAVAGCGTGFVCAFIEGLADGAVMAGIPRKDAYLYAAQALKGTAQLILETGRHPAELKDEICSPGGSTIVGMKALEDGGMRAAAMNAVFESYKKNRDMA